ncbi:unnamed protein product [Lactuca saligna]|uniref:Uncharacterized protein n=1 Tax=Lactuca saligna TaxID=75948 RepID=A0AA35V774_LACSI|nr:unnamed protein product [Lactuca saligna]
MEGSSATSFNGPRAEPSYSSLNDPYSAAVEAAPSYKDMNTGRPVSVTQDQPHMRGIHGDSDMNQQPTFKDVAPGLGKSSIAPAAGAGNVNRDAIHDIEKPYTVGDVADARRHVSVTSGTSPYDQEGKMPSNSDMRPVVHSSGGQQGGYQYTSGPKSYNGDNFGRFIW